ncbi:NAD(P)-dependent alcohol dehydrogenase [Phenylobacterium sp. SCN 70-31]|uniref:zinc-dependent alcohol dehydrogenase family protein n=1 Tax=Phenylobacterium sp. SCN 70-31 TaxID=1660129 RepID=UPI00086BEF0D|nr:NAD(P)-dependent alcohol dehydrogenase [Phenylobacterium sp. SCN 70-31]ODT87655.1 MAG: alcohol dehydrogenase [Phenylobacterium sp. SCN 70-31]
MRAYRFDKPDSLDSLRARDEPVGEPQRGEVLVRVRAVSLNYRDIAVILGRYVWDAIPGLVPCSDAAGEIVAVGEGVTAFRPGDRVISIFHPRWFGGRPPKGVAMQTYGSGADGWLTEYKVVSQEAVIPLPDGISFEDGATLPCAATTAWTALSGQTPVRAGSTVLTLGTGGVSIFALQLAKAMGARVISTTSGAAKAERLRALGADEVVNYVEIPEWGRHVRKALTGGAGVDCVVEVGGPATVGESLRAVRPGGEVVLIGFLSEANPGIDYFLLKGSNAIVRSIGVGDRAALEDLVRAWSGAGLSPVIDRVFGFDEARDAFAHLQAARHVGKIVVRVGD